MFRQRLPRGSRWQLANLVPLGVVLFDLLDNTAASVVMQAYPRSVPLAAALAPWFTAIKWSLVAASLALLLIGLAAALVSRARRIPA